MKLQILTIAAIGLLSFAASASEPALKNFVGKYKRTDHQAQCPLVMSVNFSAAADTYNGSDILQISGTKLFPGATWDGFGFIEFTHVNEGNYTYGGSVHSCTLSENTIKKNNENRLQSGELANVSTSTWSSDGETASYEFKRVTVSNEVTEHIRCGYVKIKK